MCSNQSTSLQFLLVLTLEIVVTSAAASFCRFSYALISPTYFVFSEGVLVKTYTLACDFPYG